MTNPSEIDGIGQIHISVSDIERSVAFYRDVLGLRFLFDVPGQSMAFFDCGGVRLYLGKPESAEFRSNPLLYYRVGSIQDACARLEGLGVTIEQAPHLVHKTDAQELWLAGFRDPDGTHVCLMSEVATA